MRVLRALDEEGQRQRANTLVVRVSVDVAVYTLNQKRRELARIEADNGVTIQFEPKVGVVAGNFDIERIGQRTPDDRPKLAPPPEPVFEPETIEDAETEEADVEDEDDTSEARPQEVRGGELPRGESQQREGQPRADGQPQGEGGKRRRRRRRRGRDRDRPPVGAENSGTPSIAPQHFGEGENGSPDAGDLNGSSQLGVPLEPRHDGQQLQGPQAQGAQAPGNMGEGGRRKRRRRRRGRGQREGQSFNVNDGGAERLESGPADAAPQSHEAFEESPVHGEVAQVEAGIDAPIVTPNAPSAPVWSLATHPAPEHHPAPVERKIEVAPVAATTSEATTAIHEKLPIEPVPGSTPKSVAAQAAEQPTRKGWWQRPFRLRD